ncbi:MAG: MFS transporter, partial [Bryobacteraceae bacterium]
MPQARPWAVVGFLWIAYFINYVDRQLIFSQFPALERDLGFTAAQLGWIGTVFLWVYSLTSPVAGRLADRFRPEWLVPLSLVLWSLATLGTGMSRSAPELLVWRGLIGVTEGLYFPAALALIGAVHSGATRSRAIAIHGTAQFAG